MTAEKTKVSQPTPPPRPSSAQTRKLPDTKSGNSPASSVDKTQIDRVSLSRESSRSDKQHGVNLAAWDSSQGKEAKQNSDLAASLGTKTLRTGMHDESVRALQSSLNNKLGLELDTDGKFGPRTRLAVEQFQKKHGLEPVDGIVGPKTRAALTGISPKTKPETQKPGAKKNLEGKSKPTAAGHKDKKTADKAALRTSQSKDKISFGKKLSKGQKEAIHKMVADLKARGFHVKPDDITNFMAVETAGTFSPSIRAGGKKKGAVGLAQFTGIAIKDMNRFRSAGNKLSKEKLSKMSFAQQSKVVTEYLSTALKRRGMTGKNVSAGDLYAAVFAPKAVGKSNSSTIFRSGSREYRANRSLDVNRDGRLTKGELVARLNAWAARGNALRG